ncbi:DUF6095 family protein [Schleiferia thermophila]|jgi:uncharacterized membrane protein (UPF0136 family)|uniref:Uncharacterized protein n=1 Tax=Schleiferia thermophila TaxID=884107 RepID=A0A369A891_9FLAO|nr:DUF6095 family protein [Schleiferia thermophila]KFD40243.1 hypothetical protein AT05_00625 [Schleiferia thermophila str. Yellowstone]RCX05363.1 hypothetical protein DES35_101648 [Schleiferia thermophila]GCD79130.1 hypothetical protein JCM30197_03770 [Schleiferia thermophila]
MNFNRSDRPHSNKEQLIKGATLMFGSLPFVFSGPVLFYFIGFPLLDEGKTWGILLSTVFSITAISLFVAGLLRVLKGFFDAR